MTTVTLSAERVLDPKRQKALGRVQQILGDLRRTLSTVQADPDDVKVVKESIAQLDELFLLVVVGESNAGKSAFVNALLDQQILEEGVTPTTSRIQALRYGEAVETDPQNASYDIITAPVEILKDIRIVDTPGTNAIQREHEAITEQFVPRADLILFVTSADRPFTESERAFLEGVRDWGKKIVVTVNKADILKTKKDRERVREFVAENAKQLLGVEPELFQVSARDAAAAKQAGDEKALAKSGFAALETYIRSTLDENARYQLKLLNPLGVGHRLSAKYLRVLDERLELLAGDITVADEIQTQLEVFENDMQGAFADRFKAVDLELYRFENRGHEYLDETIRIGNVLQLLSEKKTQRDFEGRVVQDLPERIEKQVQEIIDWLIESDLEQWEGVRKSLSLRQPAHAERLNLDKGFEYDRNRLLQTVGEAAAESVESYDHKAEAKRLAEAASGAVASAALIEVGAVGLGAAVSAAASTTAADITGVAAASVVAAIGLLVIPKRRHAAKRELRERVTQLRHKLRSALEAQFESEVRRSARKIDQVVAPYTRFVRAERDKLVEKRDQLEGVQGGIEAIHARISRQEADRPSKPKQLEQMSLF